MRLGKETKGWDPVATRACIGLERPNHEDFILPLRVSTLAPVQDCVLFLSAESQNSVFVVSVKPFSVSWKERHWSSSPKFPISNVTSVLHHYDFVQDIPLLISPHTLTVAGRWGLKQLHLYSILTVKSCYITKCYYLGVCCSAADHGVSSWDVGRAQNPWGIGARAWLCTPAAESLSGEDVPFSHPTDSWTSWCDTSVEAERVLLLWESVLWRGLYCFCTLPVSCELIFTKTRFSD